MIDLYRKGIIYESHNSTPGMAAADYFSNLTVTSLRMALAS